MSFFFSSRRRHTILVSDWSSDVCSSDLELSGRHDRRDDIVTPVVPAGEFWRAEDYHQDFYVKNPVRYKFYRTGCGRDAKIGRAACRERGEIVVVAVVCNRESEVLRCTPN